MEIVPKQEEGAESNTEASKEFSTEQEAKDFYYKVSQRLKDVNHWHSFAGKGTADFQLTDADGNDVERPVQPNDHFKIDIPGPGPATGDGYDWVQVEEILENDNCTSIRVRPATNPNNSRRDVAHFFSDHATSTFMVRREGKKVVAGVYGRNEKPNTGAEKVVDTVRNTAVATGAISGFSILQWKNLVHGLLSV